MYKRIKKAFKALTGQDVMKVERIDPKTGLTFVEEVETDGEAVFIGEGTEAEFLEQQEADKGFGNIFGKGKDSDEIL